MNFKESLKESFKHACTPQSISPIEPKTIKTDEQNIQKVIIQTYYGSQYIATSQFESDSINLAEQGYFPTSQSWTPGSYGCGSFIIAALFCFIVVGILAFIYMLIVKPDDGTLTVTYEFREDSNGPTKFASGEGKNCPQCAEQVKAAAKICRFCGHGFTLPESEDY